VLAAASTRVCATRHALHREGWPPQQCADQRACCSEKQEFAQQGMHYTERVGRHSSAPMPWANLSCTQNAHTHTHHTTNRTTQHYEQDRHIERRKVLARTKNSGNKSAVAEDDTNRAANIGIISSRPAETIVGKLCKTRHTCVYVCVRCALCVMCCGVVC
jgi:hypothetical protein